MIHGTEFKHSTVKTKNNKSLCCQQNLFLVPDTHYLYYLFLFFKYSIVKNFYVG